MRLFTYFVKPLFFALFLGSLLAAPEAINDAKLIKVFEQKMQVLQEKGGYTKVSELVASMADAPEEVSSVFLNGLAKTSPSNPEDSVFILASVYDCGHCDKWHLGGVSTAWALTADGLMVSNHHALALAKGELMGISDRSGNVWPVVEIVAVDYDSDICVFKVAGGDFSPLVVGKPAPIGSEVHVIGHPRKYFFYHSFGQVNRYVERERKNDAGLADWMNISADFAKGSSGGPVLNKEGMVVGMVSFTNSIYYERNKEKNSNLQMVVKNCTPVSAIRSLIEGDQ